jgi:hypothetical protein
MCAIAIKDPSWQLASTRHDERSDDLRTVTGAGTRPAV